MESLRSGPGGECCERIVACAARGVALCEAVRIKQGEQVALEHIVGQCAPRGRNNRHDRYAFVAGGASPFAPVVCDTPQPHECRVGDAVHLTPK